MPHVNAKLTAATPFIYANKTRHAPQVVRLIVNTEIFNQDGLRKTGFTFLDLDP